jgi:hypothetical protein
MTSKLFWIDPYQATLEMAIALRRIVLGAGWWVVARNPPPTTYHPPPIKA